MSHFCGLVILTPDYQKEHSFDDSLAKYDENITMPEYRKCDLSDYDKVRFVIHYYTDKNGEKLPAMSKEFWESERKKLEVAAKKEYKRQTGKDELPTSGEDYDRFCSWVTYFFKEEFARWFKKHHPRIFAKKFEELYAENGEDWNDNDWRKDENGVWAVYSTYNPDSKWDWYSVGGRWNKSIKTKAGEFVNECLLSEIDFTPYPEDCYVDSKDWLGKPCKELKEGLEWHYSKDDCPFCIVLDGKWYERGQMGWWACVSDEKDKDVWNEEVIKLLETLPQDSEVYNIDFHI